MGCSLFNIHGTREIWWEGDMTMKEPLGAPDFIPQLDWTERCTTDVTLGKSFSLAHGGP